MDTAPVMEPLLALPDIPAPIKDFIPYWSKKEDSSVSEILDPFLKYESDLRKIYAQQPYHAAVSDGLTNLVPLFAGHESNIKFRARPVATSKEQDDPTYIMPLTEEARGHTGAPAVVQDLKAFQTNFNLFSESSLVDLDWSNVVAAGSAVTTSLIPVPEDYAGSKRALREYYHEKLAPASDVDLFIYGLNEKQGLEKMRHIEESIKGSILYETT
jgi:hypothetical protein